MRRNLKTLGLALVAVFAMSAVAASAASAHTPATFTSGSDETTLTSEAKTTQIFEAGGLKVTCPDVEIHSHNVGTDQETITVEPTYLATPGSPCLIIIEGLGELEAKIDTNGCDYTFHAAGTVDLDCSTAPEGKGIEVTAFLLGKFRKCLDIGTQTGLKVHYINTTEVTGGKNVWDVDVVSTAKEEITYTKTGSCGSGEFHDASYTGEVTVWGEDSEKNPVDVTWDPTIP